MDCFSLQSSARVPEMLQLGRLFFCRQDMCNQNGQELQQLDPASISSTCLVSLQQPSGILLLEEGLLRAHVQAEPPSKRSRGRREIPPDTNKWIHLAR